MYCSRFTVINGIEDKLHIEIPGNMILFNLMSRKVRLINPLTYVAELTGKELLDVLNEARIPYLAGFDIEEKNHYEVIVYDD